MFILAPFSKSSFFWICSSRPFTSRNIQSAWWNWSGPAGMWPEASTARSGRVVSLMRKQCRGEQQCRSILKGNTLHLRPSGPFVRWRPCVETSSSREFATCPSTSSSSGLCTACCTTSSSWRGSASTTRPPTTTSGTAEVRLCLFLFLFILTSPPSYVFSSTVIFSSSFQRPWRTFQRWWCSSKAPWWRWRTSRSF